MANAMPKLALGQDVTLMSYDQAPTVLKYLDGQNRNRLNVTRLGC